MKIWKYLLGFLFLIAAATWLAVFAFPDKNFHLIACNVGEGDAILATYGNIQILTDGGPNNKVLDCLSRHLPFWDREIELVVSTHPDKDHFEGLIEVVKRYKVDALLVGKGQTSDQSYQVLEKEVGSRGIKVLKTVGLKSLRVDLIYLDILNEYADGQKRTTGTATNEESVVTRLKYQNFQAILTGDLPASTLEELIKSNSIGRVNYLKVSHHGSKTGTSLELLNLLQPQIAVISVGRNNYGHPTPEVLNLLKDKEIKILRTDEKGDVEIISDGNVVK